MKILKDQDETEREVQPAARVDSDLWRRAEVSQQGVQHVQGGVFV